MTLLSVVIPVYQAEACLHELYARIKASIESVSTDFELVLVEDGSRDHSWAIVQELSAQDPRVKGIHLSRNFGQQCAITAGLDHCDADWVVVMDCDLQDRPEGIPDLYRKAIEGFDVVLALRGQRRERLLKRLMSSLFYRIFSYLTDTRMNDRIRNFRIMSRSVVAAYRELREQIRFFAILVDWVGFKVGSIEVQHDPRLHGETNYTFGKLWALGMDTIIAYTDKPLRLMVRLGFAIAFLALLAGIYVFIRAVLLGFTVPGWAGLMVSMYFLSGIIIAVLGVNGLYLGKAFNETKKRPLYVVSERSPR